MTIKGVGRFHFDSGVLSAHGDKPAVEMDNGDTEYWVDGLAHRGGGNPAFSRVDGTRGYYEYGLAHRDEIGPAITLPDRTEMYYCRGSIHRIHRPALITSLGDEFHSRYGLIHNSDGPAIRRADGTIEYWEHGWKHRDGDKPAVITEGKKYEYWEHGFRHRNRGRPAILKSIDGRGVWYCEYWIRGNQPPRSAE